MSPISNKETVVLNGIGIAPGYRIGTALPLRSGADIWKDPARKIAKSDVAAETRRYRDAVQRLVSDIKDAAAAAKGPGKTEYRELLEGYVELVDDEDIATEINHRISANLECAETALFHVGNGYLDDIASLDDAYLRERVEDIKMLFCRQMEILAGDYHGFQAEVSGAGRILIARELTAGEVATLDDDIGIIVEAASKTSHLVIMARNQGVPVVGGLADVQAIPANTPMIIDGYSGAVYLHPDDTLIAAYRAKIAEEAQSLSERDMSPLTLENGERVHVYANIGSAKEAHNADEAGAEGIGLFRTEFIFMNRSDPPDEDSQFVIYKDVLEAFGERQVTIRTLDAGGDKALEYLNIPREDNPFLGLRSIRFCLKNPEFLLIQFRAILRASAYGNPAIMIPMIISVQEMEAARRLFQEAQAQLEREKVPFKADIPFGMMVETPAAAIQIADFLPVADFFSIGTNDLTQYVLAVDRCNEAVADLYDARHPAVLAMIRQVIETARKSQRKVSMCGEMAGDADSIPLLLEMGLRDFSVGTGLVRKVKHLIRTT